MGSLQTAGYTELVNCNGNFTQQEVTEMRRGKKAPGHGSAAVNYHAGSVPGDRHADLPPARYPTNPKVPTAAAVARDVRGAGGWAGGKSH